MGDGGGRDLERPSTSLGFTNKSAYWEAARSWDLNLSQNFSSGQLNMPAAWGRGADRRQRERQWWLPLASRRLLSLNLSSQG